MWLNITVFIIIILIVVLSLGGVLFVNNIIEDLNNNLTQLEKVVNKGRWNEAKTIYNKIEKSWERATNIFPLILDHAEFHDLEITLARMETYVDQKENNNLLPEINITLKLLENIKKQQKISLQNVF